MRRGPAALLLVPVACALPLAPRVPGGAVAAPAQEAPTLRLAVSEDLRARMKESPGELSWEELPAEITVQYVGSDALPLSRVPVELVAVGVRDGEIVGRASTPPTVATAGGELSGSDLAGSGWPPAEEWFPSAEWRPDGIGSPSGTVAPEPEAVASQIVLPSNAGGVALFASPAADELRARFRTLPVVITTWPVAGPAGADTTGG